MSKADVPEVVAETSGGNFSVAAKLVILWCGLPFAGLREYVLFKYCTQSSSSLFLCRVQFQSDEIPGPLLVAQRSLQVQYNVL